MDMTPEEKQEQGAAMRRIAKQTFIAGFILGRKRLTEWLSEPPLDRDLDMAEAEKEFANYEDKLMEIYGRRN